MAPPNRDEAYAIFKNLENGDEGIDEFFKSFHPEVKYTVPGSGRFAGFFEKKEDYYNATWKHFRTILKEPGFKFHITNGKDGVFVAPDGWAIFLMETRDTYTKSGELYDQHYAWFCKFNDDKLVVECRAYLDLGLLEDVLGTEMTKEGLTNGREHLIRTK